MPTAAYLQARCDETSSTPVLATQPETQLDLQTPSSTLRQHLDPEALPRPDYFKTLDDLHLWYRTQYGDTLQDHLEPCSKHPGPSKAPSTRTSNETKPRPKLVVCHDFKGGYNEDPHHRGYTLEHLHLVDTFIYFSHKRVSIPPGGWLSAASRTGTKVLGTLICEWKESIPDMARLLRGPERKAMPLRGEPCFSPKYVIELIKLALDRGFSGYLVNIEVSLDLGFSCSGEAWPAWVGEQARTGEMRRNAERLRGWVHFLREEGTRRFVEAGRDADEWEVMWYDSVVYPHGQLAWQDALNEYNIPFFQSAHTFFTNYTWARPPQPLPPGQLIDPADDSPQTQQLRGYGLTGPEDGGFHPQLLLSGAMADSVDRPRSDVYVGIDVFGRNCWGGLKAWKSFDMIGSHRVAEGDDALGLSVALFAPGWTWEEENAGLQLEAAQAAQKREWSDWWHIDEAFWIGVPPSTVPGTHRISLAQDDVKPVQSYFNHSYTEPARLRRRANPLGFYTNFSLGSGSKWFDRGELVYDWTEKSNSSEGEEAGFTDMGVSMPKADLLYAESCETYRSGTQGLSVLDSAQLKPDNDGSISWCNGHSVSWRFEQERVWAGTASFDVSLIPRSDSMGPTSDRILVSLCSTVVTHPDGDQMTPSEWQFTMVYDATGTEDTEILPRAGFLADMKSETVQSDTKYEDVGNGWKATTYRFRLSYLPNEALLLGFEAKNSTKRQLQLRIGALQLSPVTLSEASHIPTKLVVIPAAKIFEPPPTDTQERRLQASVLTWTASKDTPQSIYYNIWVQAVDEPKTRTWLGTSTREATSTEFCLPLNLTLPPHLEGKGLEFVITSLDILSPIEVAKGPATII